MCYPPPEKSGGVPIHDRGEGEGGRPRVAKWPIGSPS